MRLNILLLSLLITFASYAVDCNDNSYTNNIGSYDSVQVVKENNNINSENVAIQSSVVDSNLVQPKTTFWQKFKNYFKDSNKSKANKKFDFSIIGGPHYSTDAKFGIGLVGAGLFKIDRNDTILPPSSVSLFGDISSVGFFLIGIRGNTIFPKDRYRLNYSLTLYSFPSYFWGIGYDEADNNSNKTKMKRLQAQITANFLFRLAKNFYIGPVLTWNYVRGNSIERPELLHGQDLVTRNYGFGAQITYDSRDILTNASRGVYAYVQQMFRPKWLGNDYAFSSTSIQFCYYHKLWKGAIIATQAQAVLNFGDPSWALMAKLGDSNTMRGYYEGRYRDKSKLDGQIELRQHIWRRNGIVIWIGTGTVFHNKESFGHFLPNYGLGYRWEFKNKINVRLELGFGKSGQKGFIFNINEAF